MNKLCIFSTKSAKMRLNFNRIDGMIKPINKQKQRRSVQTEPIYDKL